MSSVALALALSACGGTLVGAPDIPDGWEVHESSEIGYLMAHPPDWDVELEAAGLEDVFTGPDGTEIRVVGFVVEEGWAADILFQTGESDAEDRFGAPPDVVNELTLADGARVLIFASQYTDDRGAFLFQRAVVLAPPVDLWYVDWYSDIGDEGGDRQRFLEFVESFDPAPLLPGRQGA